MKYSILNIILLIGFNLNSQSYFSKNIDIGNTNLQDIVLSMVEHKDTILFLSFNATNVTDTSFVKSSQICKMDMEGNLIECKLFLNVNPNVSYEAICIEKEHLYILDGKCCNEDAFLNLLEVDLHTLEIINSYKYTAPIDNIFEFADSDIQFFENYIVLSGWANTWNGQQATSEFFMMWIDKNTMSIDTVSYLPFQATRKMVEELFLDNNGNLVGYYLLNRLAGEGNFNSRGFIKYNKHQEIVSVYRDTLDISTGSNSSLSSNALVLKSGNMVNTQKYIDPNPIFPDHGSDYDMVCTNDKGETVWRYNTPGHSPFGRKIISNMSETKDGDILGCGSLRWFKGMKEDDYSQPFPNNEDEYNAPYIIKIDGKTGEEIWEYALIEYDAYGHQGPGSLKEFFELSDGSLFGGGSYLPKDSVTGFNNVMDVENSWFIRLPADGCHKDLGCEFENFTTSSHEINLIDISKNRLFKVFPNPTEGMLKIETDNDVTNVDILVYSTTGQKVYQNSGDITDNKEINLSELTSGTYILQFTKKGKLIQNELIFKN